MINFKINNKKITANKNETIFNAAKKVGIEIPHLCYKNGYRADGNCRSCIVEIEGERVLSPSCCRYPSENMEVFTDNERVKKSQKMVLELLLSDMPNQK